MVIKLYISGISGNKEVKKKQQRVQMILDSKQISYEAIDITEPGKEKDKEFMQQNGKVRESLGKYPLPPQIFNDDDFCGDYEDFDMANEVDELEKFLHIETSSKDNDTDTKEGEDSRSFTGSTDSSHSNLTYNPYEYHTFRIRYNGVNGMKEEIISNDLQNENELTEEVTKSEVNGESEAVPASEPSSENVTENVKAPEDVALEKEEDSTQDTKTKDEGVEKETEENVEERQENMEESEEKVEESKENIEGQEEEDEGKAEEKEEEKEEAENPKDEEVESPKEEEKSPPPEEEEGEGDNEDEKSEKEENESEEEKSQEE